MRKRIRTILYLVVVMILIYVQQSVVIYAEEETPVQLESSVEDEGNGTEEQPGDGENGESEEDPEIPPEELPEMKIYQLHMDKEDGKNGYFITKPQAFLQHVSEVGVTKYQILHGDTILIEGELSEPGASVTFAKNVWEEGKNILKIWMEDAEGNVVKEMESQKEVWIDTISPEVKLELPNGFDSWYKEKTTLSVTAKDGESKVASISCYAENNKVGESDKEHATFTLQMACNRGSGAEILVTVSDRAGNVTEKKDRVYIDNTAPKVLIQGAEDYMITSQPLSISCLAEEDNILENVSANIEWETVSGEKRTLEIKDWELGNLQVKGEKLLSEDGIYNIYVSATDKAGYKSEKKIQVILDQTNPVIRFIDELDQKYLKSFRWKYNREKIIQDFTTYTYEIRLDGRLYSLGEKVNTEGKHVLEILAKDAAGNEAKARAEFFVDHTKPEIRFIDVEDGGVYEKEKTFRIMLKNLGDEIKEIKINGEVQKLSQKGNAYQYTVNEVQDYTIEVTAVDQAGNLSQRTLFFTVEPEKTMIQKITEPVKKSILQVTKEPEEIEKDNLEPEKKNWGGIIVILLLVIVGTVIIYQKIREKRS